MRHLLYRSCIIALLALPAISLAWAMPRPDPAAALLAGWRTLGLEARAHAVQTVAKVRNPLALRPIITLLSEADAPSALAKINGVPYLEILKQSVHGYGEAAIDPLADTLSKTASLSRQRILIATLADTGSARAVKPLLDLLHRLSPQQAAAAMSDVSQALCRLGAPGMQALAGLLREDRWTPASYDVIGRQLIAAGKVSLPFVQPLLKDKDEKTRARAMGILAEYGPQIIPLGIELLKDPNAATRRWAVQVLTRWGDAGVVAPLIACLTDPNDDVRMTAATGLGKAELMPAGNPAVGSLMMLLKDQNPLVRQAAIGTLGLIGDHRAAEALRMILLSPNTTDVAVAAIALGRMKDPASVDTVLAIADTVDHPARAGCLIALQYYQDPRATTVMIKALADRDPQVRVNAIRGLGLLRPHQAVDPLLQLLVSDDDPAVRSAAAGSLASFKDNRIVDALLATLNDRTPAVSSAVAAALTQMTGQHYGPDPAAWRAWWSKQGK